MRAFTAVEHIAVELARILEGQFRVNPTRIVDVVDLFCAPEELKEIVAATRSLKAVGPHLKYNKLLARCIQGELRPSQDMTFVAP